MLSLSPVPAPNKRIRRLQEEQTQILMGRLADLTDLVGGKWIVVQRRRAGQEAGVGARSEGGSAQEVARESKMRTGAPLTLGQVDA